MNHSFQPLQNSRAHAGRTFLIWTSWIQNLTLLFIPVFMHPHNMHCNSLAEGKWITPLLVLSLSVNVHQGGGFLYDGYMCPCRKYKSVLCGRACVRTSVMCWFGVCVWLLCVCVRMCEMLFRQLPSCLLWMPASLVGMKETWQPKSCWRARNSC